MSKQNVYFERGDIPDIFEDITAYDRAVHEDNLLLLYECEKDLKRTLHLLNAQKRGQEALAKEVIHMQEKEKKKRQLLDQRRKVLDNEKKRALKVASRELPMPVTIKCLLKESGKSNSSTKDKIPDVQESVPEITFDLADKENHLSELNAEKKEKMMKEWNTKAKERYTIALQKDRKKKEYEESLKQLENADKFKRRQFAQQLPSNKDIWYPCDQSDKLKSSRHQVKMQNAVEKVASGCKEHVIEELEGYNDHVEERFLNKEFNLSEKDEKLLDCVPTFIQRNYQYLLEEEKFNYEFGQDILNESSEDVLNQAYIESPPCATVETEDELEKVIVQLKERRNILLTQYEQEVSSGEDPTKKLHDKAIATEAPMLEEKGISTDQLPFEEKGICTEPLIRLKQRHLLSRSTQVDLSKAGFLSEDAKNSRSHHISIDRFLRNNKVFPSLQEETPKRPIPNGTEFEAWSSSSYCSLPSKHGMPQFPEEPQTSRCQLCVDQLKKKSQKHHFQLDQTDTRRAGMPQFAGVDESTRAKTSDHIRNVAEKYFPVNALKVPYASTVSIPCAVPLSEPVRTRPTSSKTVQVDSEEILSSIGFNENFQLAEKHPVLTPSGHANLQESDAQNLPSEEESGKIAQKPSSLSDLSQILESARDSSNDVDTSELKDASEKKEILHQIISSYLPELLSSSTKSNEQDKLNQPDLLNENINISELPDATLDEPYVYHDLSTIQEMDSILTNGNQSHSLLKAQKSLDLENQGAKTEVEKPDTQKKQDLEHSSIQNHQTIPSEISKDPHYEPQSPGSDFIKVIKDLKSSINEAETKLQSIAGVEKRCISTPSDLSKQSLKSDSQGSVASSSETLEQHTIQSLTPSQPETSNDRLNLRDGFFSPESLEQFSIESFTDDHDTRKNYQHLTTEHKLPESVASSPGLLEQHSVVSNIPKGTTQLFSPNSFYPTSALSTPETLQQYTILSLESDQSGTPSGMQKQTSGQHLFQGDLATAEFSKQVQSLPSNQLSTPSEMQNQSSKSYFPERVLLPTESLQQFALLNLTSKTASPTGIQDHASSGNLEQHTIVSFSSSSSSISIPFQFKIPKETTFLSSNLHKINQVKRQNKSESKNFLKSKEKETYTYDSAKKLTSDFRHEQKDPSTSRFKEAPLNQLIHSSIPPPKDPKRYDISSSERNFGTATPVYQTSSSDENLSELFTGSKIAYQSTPIKTDPDYEQERGILEEPDLTLVPSESTIMSPEKLRAHTSIDASNRHDETFKTILSQLRNAPAEEQESRGVPKFITNAQTSLERHKAASEVSQHEDALKSLLCKLKSSSTKDQGSPNVVPNIEVKSTVHIKDTKIHMQEAHSNSMLSFLMHEISCCVSSCSTESPASEGSAQTEGHTCDSPCYETPSGENFCSGTPSTSQGSSSKSKPDFKQRTKRLWNNLEEVKQKKLNDDKEKQKATARDKMKEFSKKLNKKKTTPKK